MEEKTIEETLAEKYQFLDLSKPNNFALVTNVEHFSGMLDFYNRVGSKQFTNDKKHRIRFIFLHYDFVKRHVESIIEEFESIACKADKSTWLIEQYINYIENAEMPAITVKNEKDFWIPQCTNWHSWFKFIESIERLYYGKTQEFISSHKEILDEYSRVNVSTM